PKIEDPDSTRPVQYRRGIPLQEGYQTYEQKYNGKDLEEIKRSLFPLESTGIWTELNPGVPRVDYVGVHFSNKDIGWAVGDLGALIKTTDGGANWKTIQTNITVPILKIRSINGQTVIASGYSGLILRSTDGGETFTQVESGLGAGFDLWGLEIVNDTLGWACGATALLKTTDGGESWQIINIPGYTGNLWWIDFMNENYGFVAADGKVLKTTDGGNNWEIIQAGDDRPLYCINIIDSSHIAAAGYGGTNYSAKNIYSNDGGYTWIHGGNLTTEEVNCIKYVSADTGYLVMSNVSAWKTTNRGTEWTTIQGISDTYELQILENINEIIGYSAGTGLKISKTENGYENWERLIMNDNFSDVCFVSEEKGFALGNYNVLYKTTDGGINWTAKGVLGSCITFIDSLKGFIGSSGAIWKTTDGGNNWYITNGANGASKIFIKNETTGWAIRNNIIYKTTDSGDNWFTQFTAPTSVRFTSIYFVDSLYGWTANLGGRPYKTTNGGIEWVQQANLDIWASLDVFFKDYLNGFILESNKLYRTTDSGLTFNLISRITGFSIAAKFSNHGDSIIFITGYKTYRSIDGGMSWLDFNELTSTRINGLSLLEPGLGYGIGELGLVLRYYDETVPVELINFSGMLNENFVFLNWVTASEANNYGFEIEKISATIQEWKKIGFVEGNGTTT
ncbi:MAG TPA: YCF48-related protein, partial [Ignavibacteriaceae bacterium]|nr:YCF48-related protein [Ignavibacteriaceae bacterium]